MTIDPKLQFGIGLVITLAILISNGSIHLSHALPEAWIPAAVAWAGIIAGVGSAIQTTMSGMGMSQQSRLAGASSVPLAARLDAVASSPEVKRIEVPRGLADATASAKIVAAPVPAPQKGP